MLHKKAFFIFLLSLLGHTSHAGTFKKEIEERDLQKAQAYFESLSGDDQLKVNHLIQKVQTSSEALVEISPKLENTSSGEVYFLVQGIDFEPHYFWEPFLILEKSQHPAFFHSWSKRELFEKNLEKLKANIEILLKKFSQSKIKIFAFSAGGVLALKVWDDLAFELSEKDFHRVELHAIAASVNGYGVPKYLGKITGGLFGYTMNVIGVGVSKSFKHSSLEGCEQWITVNCELDPHACARFGKYPQIMENSLCSHVPHFLAQETHPGALVKVMREHISQE